MSEQINLAIVGCGVMGGTHARHALACDQFNLRYVCDPDQGKADQLAAETGAAACTDFGDVLSRDIDAVLLAIPHKLHRDYTVAALEANKHVLLEKPISCNEQDAEAIIRAAGHARAQLLVAHVLRFYPANYFIYNMIQEGSLGKLFQIKYHHEHNSDISTRPWIASKEEGGVIIGGGIHHTDVLAWWGGPIKAVRAYGQSITPLYQEQGTQDHALIIYEFENGTLGQSIYSMATHQHTSLPDQQAMLSFEHGTFHMSQNGDARLICARPAMGYEAGSHDFKLDTSWSAGLRNELTHFADCINGARLRLTAEDAAYALRVACAARQSAEAEEMGMRICVA